MQKSYVYIIYIFFFPQSVFRLVWNKYTIKTVATSARLSKPRTYEYDDRPRSPTVSYICTNNFDWFCVEMYKTQRFHIAYVFLFFFIIRSDSTSSFRRNIFNVTFCKYLYVRRHEINVSRRSSPEFLGLCIPTHHVVCTIAEVTNKAYTDVRIDSFRSDSRDRTKQIIFLSTRRPITACVRLLWLKRLDESNENQSSVWPFESMRIDWQKKLIV